MQTNVEGKLPLSASVGRANGSIVARAILQSIMASKELQKRSSFRDESPYFSLESSIFDAHMRHNPTFKEHQIHFSAQNDWWANNYQPRIGIALRRLKEVWESLLSSPGMRMLMKSQQLLENEDTCIITAGGTCHRILDRTIAPRTSLYSQLMWLINKKSEFSDMKIDRLFRTLHYRLAILEHVDELVKVMGLQMPSIADFETRDWKGSKEEEELYSKA